MMVNNEELADTIAAHLPYDGPHTRETVLEGAEALSALVRYLHNATGPGNGTHTLEWAATTYGLLSFVESATYGLDQLCGQLATALQQQAENPTLYDDRRDRPATTKALAAATRIDDARRLARYLAAALGDAQQLTAHLGNH